MEYVVVSCCFHEWSPLFKTLLAKYILNTSGRNSLSVVMRYQGSHYFVTCSLLMFEDILYLFIPYTVGDITTGSVVVALIFTWPLAGYTRCQVYNDINLDVFPHTETSSFINTFMLAAQIIKIHASGVWWRKMRDNLKWNIDLLEEWTQYTGCEIVPQVVFLKYNFIFCFKTIKYILTNKNHKHCY